MPPSIHPPTHRPSCSPAYTPIARLSAARTPPGRVCKGPGCARWGQGGSFPQRRLWGGGAGGAARPRGAEPRPLASTYGRRVPRDSPLLPPQSRARAGRLGPARARGPRAREQSEAKEGAAERGPSEPCARAEVMKLAAR